MAERKKNAKPLGMGRIVEKVQPEVICIGNCPRGLFSGFLNATRSSYSLSSLALSISLRLSVSIYLSVPLPISLFLSACLSAHLSVSLSLSLVNSEFEAGVQPGS